MSTEVEAILQDVKRDKNLLITYFHKNDLGYQQILSPQCIHLGCFAYTEIF